MIDDPRHGTAPQQGQAAYYPSPVPGEPLRTARQPPGDGIKTEHGFSGGETIVKAYVREQRLQGREMFVPLVHPPGHGQADFGEAVAMCQRRRQIGAPWRSEIGARHCAGTAQWDDAYWAAGG